MYCQQPVCSTLFSLWNIKVREQVTIVRQCKISIFLNYDTRSSAAAAAEGRHDALCQLKSRLLPHKFMTSNLANASSSCVSVSSTYSTSHILLSCPYTTHADIRCITVKLLSNYNSIHSKNNACYDYCVQLPVHYTWRSTVKLLSNDSKNNACYVRQRVNAWVNKPHCQGWVISWSLHSFLQSSSPSEPLHTTDQLITQRRVR